MDTLYQAYRAEYCSPPLFAPGRLVPANMSSCVFREKKKEEARASSRGSFALLKTPHPRPPFSISLAHHLPLRTSPKTAPGFSLTFSLGNCDLSLGDRSLECVAPYVRYRQTPAVLTGPHVRPGFFVGETCRAAAAFGTPQRNILFVLDPKKPRDMPSPSELAGLVADEVVNVFTDAAAGAGSALGAAFPAGAVPALFGGPGGGAATSTAVVGGGDGAATTSAGGR